LLFEISWTSEWSDFPKKRFGEWGRAFPQPDERRSDLSQALKAFGMSIVNRKIIFCADMGGRR
jgi:hypothetical protein